MTLFSLITAFALEQWRALDRKNPFALAFLDLADSIERRFNGGEVPHGMTAWFLAVIPPVLVTGAVQGLLADFGFLLEWAWSVAVLYVTMGFRKFSGRLREVQESLARDDLEGASAALHLLRGRPGEGMSRNEVARVAIEEGLLLSHRYVFGVVFWFVVLGPAGAVLYRCAADLAERWGGRAGPEAAAFGRFSIRGCEIMDWIPVRLSAITFAVVGNFEEAIYCWRTQAMAWSPENHGILLASGAGALGIRLGETLQRQGGESHRPVLGTGEEAEPEHMRSAVGLVWRALVFWMGVILAVSAAYWLG